MNIDLRNFIHDVPDFPKEGILFKDVSPLLKNPGAFAHALGKISDEWEGHVDAIAVLDARGFLFGGVLAYTMGLPMVMMRKKGKLPGKTLEVTYDLEYGSATLEVQEGAFDPNARVLIIDDLLATGGTAAAACDLVEKSGASVEGCAFIVELSTLDGRGILAGRKIQALVNY